MTWYSSMTIKYPQNVSPKARSKMFIHLAERFRFYPAFYSTSEPSSERVRDIYYYPLLSLIGFYSLYARAWGRPRVSKLVTCYKIYVLLGVTLHKMLQLSTTCYKSHKPAIFGGHTARRRSKYKGGLEWIYKMVVLKDLTKEVSL